MSWAISEIRAFCCRPDSCRKRCSNSRSPGGDLRTVQAKPGFVAKGALLLQALLETRDDFGVHAAMMVAGHIRDALSHALGQTHDEFVSGTA